MRRVIPCKWVFYYPRDVIFAFIFFSKLFLCALRDNLQLLRLDSADLPSGDPLYAVVLQIAAIKQIMIKRQ